MYLLNLKLSGFSTDIISISERITYPIPKFNRLDQRNSMPKAKNIL